MGIDLLSLTQPELFHALKGQTPYGTFSLAGICYGVYSSIQKEKIVEFVSKTFEEAAKRGLEPPISRFSTTKAADAAPIKAFIMRIDGPAGKQKADPSIFGIVQCKGIDYRLYSQKSSDELDQLPGRVELSFKAILGDRKPFEGEVITLTLSQPIEYHVFAIQTSSPANEIRSIQLKRAALLNAQHNSQPFEDETHAKRSVLAFLSDPDSQGSVNEALRREPLLSWSALDRIVGGLKLLKLSKTWDASASSASIEDERQRSCDQKELVAKVIRGFLHFERELSCFRNDSTVVRAEMENRLRVLQRALKSERSLLSNLDFMMSEVNKDGNAVKFALGNLKNNESLAEAALRQCGRAFKHLSDQLQEKEKLMRLAVAQDETALECMPDSLRANKVFVTYAVSQHGKALEHASNRLQSNEDVVKAAIEEDGMAVEFAADSFKKNSTIAKIALKRSGRALCHLPIFQDDKDMVLLAVNQNGMAIEFASERLKGDEDVVKAAIKQTVLAWSYLRDNVRHCKRTALILVEKAGAAVAWVPAYLDDNDVMAVALNQDGEALMFGSERIKDDDGLVAIAVNQNPLAFKYASKRIRDLEYLPSVELARS